MRYFIIPKADVQIEVEGNNKTNAREAFVRKMSLDMNKYFDVVREDDLVLYQTKRNLAESKRHFMEFAIDTLLKDFTDLDDGEPSFNEDEATEIAAIAWGLWCGDTKGGEGLTQGECIEEAIDIWDKEQMEKENEKEDK